MTDKTLAGQDIRPGERILLADDDATLNTLLAEYLTAEGFLITQAFDGRSALMLAQQNPFDAIILDIMMPQLNGLDVLRALRATHNTPVIMLTAKGDEVDHVVGLEIGADDYLGKPCSPRHLVARIRAVLRRTQAANVSGLDQLMVDDLVLSKRTREVRCQGQLVTLTSSEFQLLQVLAEHAGSVVTKQQLSQQAFARVLEKYDRSLDMHMSNLRRKLPLLSTGVERIQTVRGIGYQLLQLREE